MKVDLTKGWWRKQKWIEGGFSHAVPVDVNGLMRLPERSDLMFVRLRIIPLY